jgi:AmmeMemoRadiSam system protein B/AmmeMemoRadiSam system protein A
MPRQSRNMRGIFMFPFYLLLAVGAFSLEVEAMNAVREPFVAGQFYPNDAAHLREMIEGYLSKVQDTAVDGEIVALLAPHAGYMYSGQVAAWAYRQAQGKSFDTVAVLSPSHRVPFRGVSTLTRGAYRTPLGLVPIDEERCQILLDAHDLIQEIPRAHGPEHALEVQLPFLQTVLKGKWHLIPLIMGSQDLETARVLADALQKAIQGTRALVIASSDLSHFHQANRAEEMDLSALRYLEEVDPEGLWEEIRDGKVEACGTGPILVALLLARQEGIQKGTLLKYAHSGDVTGDRSQVVGYAAMIWNANPLEKEKEGPAVGVDLGLSNEEKEILKEIARTTIQCRLEGNPPPRGYEGVTPILKEPRGAFVTLEKRGQLRGCIGLIEAIKPLYQTVQEMAEAAAFRDPRFPALRIEEWPEVEIEISVLTPLREVQDASEIQVGLHGLCIVKGPYRGLLLPQVATDHNWDRETFLAHTCMKAGLPNDAWKDPGAKVYIFSSDIF